MMLGENQDPCFQTEEDSIPTSPTITTDDEGNEVPDLSLNKKDVLQVISMMEKNNGKETVEGLLQRINKSKLPNDNNNESDSTTKNREDGGKESSSFKEDTMRAIMSTASKNLPSSSKKKISPDAVYKLAFQITNSVVDSVKLGKYEEESSDIGSSSSSKDASKSSGGDDPFSAMTKSNKRGGASAKRSRSMTGNYGSNLSKHYKEGMTGAGFELSDPMIGNVNIPGMEQGGNQHAQISNAVGMNKNFAFPGMGAMPNMFMNHPAMNQQQRLMQQHFQANSISPAHARAYLQSQMASGDPYKQQQQLQPNMSNLPSTTQSPYHSKPPTSQAATPNKETFPMVLHRALLELDGVEGGSDIAMFVPNGSAFCIVDTEAFEQSVMSMYFPRLKSFSSFILQLNVYEFERLDSPLLKSKFAYFHTLFHRDNAQCVSQMRPRKRKSL